MSNILYLVCLLSSCSVLDRTHRFPPRVQHRIICVKEFVENINTEETINICKFVTEEQK